jgi:hypothetical protein
MGRSGTRPKSGEGKSETGVCRKKKKNEEQLDLDGTRERGMAAF